MGILKSDNRIKRIRKVIELYPDVLSMTPDNNLHCQICNKCISSDKDYNILSHLNSKAHKARLIKITHQIESNNWPGVQEFHDNNPQTNKIAKIILETFLAVNIPLYKLRHPKFQEFFKTLGQVIPSESTIRNSIDNCYESEMPRIKELVRNEYVFIVVDETSNDCKYYNNVLIGLIKSPKKTYGIKIDVADTPPNSDYITKLIMNTLNIFNIHPRKLLVLLSDAARYMVSSATELKNHILTCFISPVWRTYIIIFH